ncbi:hypothetical protein C1701_03845 [Actinoalloteichus sp. AHMU CJ021]|uniref:Pycsar effector protein domain-containing protein n=1 Tax=Actinoalloteichus caeruleus DSM 43889 TaxID=1120930 RepID=A0ABT1JGB7_ACTCY|nr:hypothetical protein [Actinoalloteichus caeruleus]AUS77646.1 hypothetical protein C1701_03845 [Actinoalloteichus sp. AHMU CJ021]MCP2331547.1 hypothetical protein [Actinoalloteichus caeruleus DSM 43889]
MTTTPDDAVMRLAREELADANRAPYDAATRAAKLRRTHLALSAAAAGASWLSLDHAPTAPLATLTLVAASAVGVLVYAGLLWITAPRLRTTAPVGWLRLVRETPEETIARWQATVSDPVRHIAEKAAVRARIGVARYRLLRAATVAVAVQLALIVTGTALATL